MCLSSCADEFTSSCEIWHSVMTCSYRFCPALQILCYRLLPVVHFSFFVVTLGLPCLYFLNCGDGGCSCMPLVHVDLLGDISAPLQVRQFLYDMTVSYNIWRVQVCRVLIFTSLILHHLSNPGDIILPLCCPETRFTKHENYWHG